MDRVIIFIKYTGAVFVFWIVSLLCLVIAEAGIALLNYDIRGFWVYLLPYFSVFVSSIIGVMGGLTAVERLFSTVRLRTVVWIIIGIYIFFWGIPLLSLFIGFIFVDIPVQSNYYYIHLWSERGLLMAVSALVTVITALKLTEE